MWGVMERSYSGWAGVATRTATFYPGVVLAIFTFINIAIKSAGEAAARQLSATSREQVSVRSGAEEGQGAQGGCTGITTSRTAVPSCVFTDH